MARSRPFGLFILALCLVACVCAHGDVSADDAKKAVGEAQISASKVFGDLKLEVTDAIQMRNDVKIYKQNAKEAAEEAEKTAKGNQEAEAIAETAKSASAEVLKLYTNAFDLADKYADNMKRLRTRAKVLNDKASQDLPISELYGDNFTKVIEDADIIKAQAEALKKEMNDTTNLYNDVMNAQKEMPKFMSAAQLAKYHVDVIVAVAKIDTLLKSADTDIGLSEQKKTEINVTEQEMKKLSDNSPTDLIRYLSRLHSIVEDHASSASHEVKKAKEAKTHMLEQKAQADEALVKVKAEKDVDNAESEAGDARRAVKDAEKQIEEIKKTLESVTKSATDALRWKNSALNAISQKTQKADATQENDKMTSKDSENTHQPVQDTTESPVESETKKPTVTNPDQSMTEQPVQDTTESPVESGTKKPTVTNPGKPGSGGTESTQPSSSDSAMTVSVPLLFALIACAALR